ncbi:unnamed protein product [Coregonus sp. 'balchen']|nr:unnamed protein product [Coregonus sp. 'balchen']
MNTALRHWKEAATVILAAGVSVKAPLRSVGHSSLPDKLAFDYNVLLLKRSGTSGFMPNAYVFPGGLVDSSDFSSEWLDLFKSFRRSPNFGLGFVKQPPETRPPIFATDRKKLGSPIPGDVAFRICAVRETFEESGVLLVVPKEEESTLLNGSRPELTRITDVCDESELAKWRVLVNENPSNFIRMCRELECLPNIWALHEWGNWLTPTGVYGKQRRYDTAFYICCLQETPPHTLQDEKEIVHFKWSTPSEILHSYQAREMWIAPPQFYDLSRMCRFPSLQDLHSFSRRRASEGCDELYPEEGSCQMNVTLNTDQSLDEMHQGSSALHRIVALDPYTAAAIQPPAALHTVQPDNQNQQPALIQPPAALHTVQPDNQNQQPALIQPPAALHTVQPDNQNQQPALIQPPAALHTVQPDNQNQQPALIQPPAALHTVQPDNQNQQPALIQPPAALHTVQPDNQNQQPALIQPPAALHTVQPDNQNQQPALIQPPAALHTPSEALLLVSPSPLRPCCWFPQPSEALLLVSPAL